LGRRTLHSKTSLGGVGSNVALASRGRFLRTPAPKAQCAKIEPGLVFGYTRRDNGASSFRWSITAAEGCSQSPEKAVFDPRVLNGARGSGMPATLPLGSRHLCFQGIEATAVCEP
jgi:hypothetical protein